MDITLSEIHQRLSHIWERVEKQGGEMSREQEEKINSLNLARDIKVANIASIVKELQAVLSTLEKEKEEIEKRKRDAEQRLNSLTRYLSKLVGERTGFNCGSVKLTWEKTAVVEVDEDEVPDEYYVQRVLKQIDKQLIKEKLEQGKDIPGARLKHTLRLLVD